MVVVRPAESRNSRVCAMSSAVRAKLRLTKSTSNSPARDCRPRAHRRFSRCLATRL